jgi:hypothetical protein
MDAKQKQNVVKEVESLIEVLTTRGFATFARSGVVYVEIVNNMEGGVELYADDFYSGGRRVELNFYDYAREQRYPKWIAELAERFGESAHDFVFQVVYNLNYMRDSELEKGLSLKRQLEIESRFKKMVQKYMKKMRIYLIREVMERI